MLPKGARYDSADKSGEIPLVYSIEGEKIKKSRNCIQIFKTHGADLSFYFEQDNVKTTHLLHAIR